MSRCSGQPLTSLHFFRRLLGSQWNSSQTQGSGPKLSWAGSGSKDTLFFLLLQHNWPQPTAVSSLFLLFPFVLNGEDGGVECVAPPAEPEAAQQSGQVCGDIVVRVVYSTVASTQWSKRQIRDIIQMVQYSYSTTSIHQLYIVRCFFCLTFFFSPL